MGSKSSLGLVGILAAAILVALLPTASLAAPPVCKFDGATATVTIAIPRNETATLSRTGDAILLDGAACDTATVTNTDLVLFVNAANMPGKANVTIDLTGGPFAPGLTPESDGNSEIEIWHAFTNTVAGTLKVIGSADADRVDVMAGFSEGAFGNWLDLNMGGPNDGEGDICAGLFERFEFDLGPGDDRVSLDDVEGFSLPSVLRGGPGDDVLPDGSSIDEIHGGPGVDTLLGYWTLDIDLRNPTFPGPGGDQALSEIENVHALSGLNVIVGTDGRNELIGGPTKDFIFGGGGNDGLIGRGGEDVLAGELGDDLLRGARGEDTLLGGRGDDELLGATGADTLYGGEDRDLLFGGTQNDELRGGPGIDRCLGGPGVDVLRACEL